MQGVNSPEKEPQQKVEATKDKKEIDSIPVIGMQHSHSPKLFEIGDKAEFTKTAELTLRVLYSNPNDAERPT